ncbi:hypothetical protein [Ligilactobacillus salivarius]|uniref:hypothetical protein n=1 Tax=Ligilactobacillus salivarius TaxID=1624 RepID=UPI00296757E6|nr:hypothetical protein [Ligilactobacillus salivarius]MDW3023690.1 hypothetical protein [Ligilactobacillus salivarius]
MVNSIKTKKILTAEEKVTALKAKLAAEEKKLQKIRKQEKDNFIKKVGQKIVDEFNITDEEELETFIELVQSLNVEKNIIPLDKDNEAKSANYGES